jgi:hypothetical protein
MEVFIFNFYQKLGEYFTGSSRKKPLFILLLGIFILINFLSYQFKIIIETDTLYWVFSSLVQALLSLVALIGVVSIFKLQNFHQDERKILDEVNDDARGYFMFLNKRFFSLKELSDAVEVHLSQKPSQNGFYFVSLDKRIQDCLLSKKLVIEYSAMYTIYTFFTVLVSLLFLMLVPQISVMYLGFTSLYLMFVLSSYSLFLAAKGVIYGVGG